MATLSEQLELNRCPHCNVDTPNLPKMWAANTTTHDEKNKRIWKVYKCTRCGGIVTAASSRNDHFVTEIYPYTTQVDESIPDTAREYLKQALDSIHAPAGAIMLAASSVDSMLKTKKYIKGDLYSRIKKAATDHLITEEMEKWAHQVRLDANDQRHADEKADLPEQEDARKTIEFALALGEFLFVLPSKVSRGLEETEA